MDSPPADHFAVAGLGSLTVHESANVTSRLVTPWPVRVAAQTLWISLAAGVLLFGAVYPWAYLPLLSVAALVGAYGWTTADPRARAAARPVRWVVIAAFSVGVWQLVPLPPDLLDRVSPATDPFLRQMDGAYVSRIHSGARPIHGITISPAATSRGLWFLATLGTFVVGATALLPRIPLAPLVRAITILGVAVAVFGIVQRATFNGLIYWIWTPVFDSSNAFGPFVNRNHFAGWMLMAVSLTGGYLCALMAAVKPTVWSSRPRAIEWLSSPAAAQLTFTSFAVLVMAMSIVWTMSRSGIAALAIAGLLVSGRVIAAGAGRRRFVTAVLIIGAVAVAVLWRGTGTLVDWYARTGTLEWRIQLWRDTLPIVQDFLWWGTGLNTYGVSTLVYPMTDRNWHAVEAHSDYVQILAEGGVILSVVVLCGLIAIARRIRNAFAEPQTDADGWLRTGATVGLVAIGVQELSDFSLQMPGNALLFCTLLAIALHRARPPRSTTTPKARAVVMFPGGSPS